MSYLGQSRVILRPRRKAGRSITHGDPVELETFEEFLLLVGIVRFEPVSKELGFGLDKLFSQVRAGDRRFMSGSNQGSVL